ncbi:F-box/WD repeat-containing protein 4-like [Oncorhynchus clarkii lewisi]|uniref:F-box/WD repeat-containing protein 4-like n=1 Tax=Oncorhynchus clarkii lewisi TaxID=490388 RepID=UPI0039B89127
MFLFQLPDDVLYHIMSNLEYKSLSRLSQVCKTVYQFANRDAVRRKIEKVECHDKKRMCKKYICYSYSRLQWSFHDKYLHIPLKDRVKVSQNWSHGICRKEVTLKWRINLLPWIQPQWGCAVSVSGCRHRSVHLVSGGRDGKILVHHRRNGFSLEYSGHKQEVNCLGCIGGLMVCGSRDRTARIWTLSSNCPRGTIPMNDKVWSVAISPTWRCELLCCLGSESQREAGVVDIDYESPFQQLTCDYDAYIRSWDLRLSPRKCVMEWEEPHDSALYCIQTDGNHMIASGSSYDGVIRMWDKWQTRCVEMLQLSSAVSSPVWSPDAALHHSSSWSNSPYTAWRCVGSLSC